MTCFLVKVDAVLIWDLTVQLPKRSSSYMCSVTQSCWTLCHPMDYSPPGSSCPWNFSGKDTEVHCHFPPPGDLPNPGIESVSFASPILVGRFLPLPPPGKPKQFHIDYYKFLS